MEEENLEAWQEVKKVRGAKTSPSSVIVAPKDLVLSKVKISPVKKIPAAEERIIFIASVAKVATAERSRHRRGREEERGDETSAVCRYSQEERNSTGSHCCSRRRDEGGKRRRSSRRRRRRRAAAESCGRQRRKQRYVRRAKRFGH